MFSKSARQIKSSGKNLLHKNCKECGEKKMIAHWDEELESFIFLEDEPYLCESCQKQEV